MSHADQNPSNTYASLIRTLQTPNASQFANHRILRKFRELRGASGSSSSLPIRNLTTIGTDQTADATLLDHHPREDGAPRIRETRALSHDWNALLNEEDLLLDSSSTRRAGRRHTSTPTASATAAAASRDFSKSRIGTKLYNFMIFNLGLSVPLSIILLILSCNFGRINERFLPDSRSSFNFDVRIWRHLFSSLMLDLCFLMCYVIWVDYCVNGLILFRYVSVLIQVLAEKLTGYRGSGVSDHLLEAQHLFLSRFSWKKWFMDALHFSSIVDVYKFHSVLWFAYVLLFFVVRNHIHPRVLPWGFHLVFSCVFCAFLALSFTIGVGIQIPFGYLCRRVRNRMGATSDRGTAPGKGVKFHSLFHWIKSLRRLNIFNSVSQHEMDDSEFFSPHFLATIQSSGSPTASSGPSINDPDSVSAPVVSSGVVSSLDAADDSGHYQTEYSSRRSSQRSSRQFQNNKSLNRSPSLTFILDEDDEKQSLISVLLENLFVFVLYSLIGSGCVLVSLRMDEIAFTDLSSPSLLFIPFFVALFLVLAYNLLNHLQLSAAYVYQRNRFYVKSACIMMFFFVFLLVQSMCICYIGVAYGLKLEGIWPMHSQWFFVFLPLCAFEIGFSMLGLTIIITAGLRMLWWMYIQARTVSTQSGDVSDDVELL